MGTGRQPGLDRGFELRICPPCRAGDHPHCKPFRDARRRYVYCECLENACVSAFVDRAVLGQGPED